MGNVLDQEPQPIQSQAACRCAWAGRAAAAWAALFAAPHVWWAFGVPAGFPGGAAGLSDALNVPWFRAYDLLVVALSCMAVLVAMAASRARSGVLPLAWAISGVLLARGLAGLAVDGLADLVWSPLFVTGGLLFGATAWLCGRRARPRATAVAPRIE
jgi:hypothetical protein